MSETNITKFKNWGMIAGAIMAIIALFSTLFASPREIKELDRRIIAIEARSEQMETRSKADHDVLTRVEQNQLNLILMVQEMKIQLRMTQK